MGLLVAVVALAATPAISMAGPGKGKGKGKSGNHHCKTLKRGFTLRGTLVSFNQGDVSVQGDEDISITVTGANRHARRAGWEKGDTFSKSDDAFKYKLVEFEPSEQPTGDTPGNTPERVKIVGKIAYTKKKCAEPGTSLADRYGAVNIRRVTIKDLD
jgi:hypothetical protein